MSARGVTITDRDKGYRSLMRKLQRDLRNRAITVGIHGEEGSAGKEVAEDQKASGLTVGDVANFHEFGMGNNPQRSFIGGWFDTNLEENKEILRRVLEQVVKGGMGIETALARVGLRYVAGVQAFMNAGIAPAKADGNTSYLTVTGQLKSSVRSKVE